MNDFELLQEYARNKSQEAFQELVSRHLVMVYAAAHRMVREAPLAEEVAQNVFTALAEKAGTLAPPQSVGGWLYNTTRHFAFHAVRADQRRRDREQTAAAMQSLETHSSTDGERITEHLEPAMAELESDDRDALVLRYLESRTLRDVGEGLGISEDAARMRVNRALERLRTVFDRRGITITSAALAVALSSTTGASLPAALGTTIVTAALTAATTTLVTSGTATTLSFMNAKIATTILGAILLTGTGTYLFQQREIGRLRVENQSLAARQQQLEAAEIASAAAAQASTAEVERLRKETTVSAAVTPTPSPAIAPGTFISMDQLAFTGYATPEAALQSAYWAIMKGTYEDMLKSVAPEIAEREAKDAQAREHFQQKQGASVVLIKGFIIMAKKVISDDKVQLKIRTEATDPANNARVDYSIQPVIKFGDEWKFGDNTISYSNQWDQDGQIEVYRHEPARN